MKDKEKSITITITVKFGEPIEFAYKIKNHGVNDFEVLGIIDQAKERAMGELKNKYLEIRKEK